MAEPAEAPAAPRRRGSRRRTAWLVFLAATMVELTVGGVLLLVGMRLYFVPSPAMAPTLDVGDRLLVNRLSYRLGEVDRGDIVVFERSPNGAGTIRELVKRVVAMEGDTIESRGDTLFVNDQPLDEPYLRGTGTGGAVTRRTIPENQVFVLGDNRANSSDSRVFGPIGEDAITGRVVAVVWPLGDLSRL